METRATGKGRPIGIARLCFSARTVSEGFRYWRMEGIMSENAAAWLGLPSIRFGVSTKNIIRVFPRRTRATPDDDLVRVKCGPGLFDFEADVAEIHVSVSFTYDKSYAEYLAEQWRGVAPVSIGGPAYLSPGEDFVPGRYLKRANPGYQA